MDLMIIAKKRAKLTEAAVIMLRLLLRQIFLHARVIIILTQSFHVLGGEESFRSIDVKIYSVVL